MTKYWQNSLVRFAKSSALVALALGAAVGCTDTDDTTGNNGFIPDGGEFQFYLDNFTGFKTSTVVCDSMATDALNNIYLGSSIFPMDGLINYGLVSQVSPGGVLYKDNNDAPFGKDPIIDSAFLFISFKGYSGEKDKRYTVYVHEMEQELPYGQDSTYYSNFPIDRYIDSKPLFSIETKLGEQIKFAIPMEYAKKLMSYKAEDYNDYAKFRNKQKGYYLSTSQSYNGEQLGLIDADNTSFYIYYRNKNEKPDTAGFAVDFKKYYIDVYGTAYLVNKQFNTITRDYSLKDPILGVDFNNPDVTLVSAMAGLTTEFEITSDVINQIRAKVAEYGGSKIIVSNATVTIPIGDLTPYGRDNALKNIGLYEKFQRMTLLQDYMSSTSANFGGSINLSTNEYKMNVTSLIQGLVNGSYSQNKVIIGPGFNDIESLGVAKLENSAAKPIKLSLKYSVVR